MAKEPLEIDDFYYGYRYEELTKDGWKERQVDLNFTFKEINELLKANKIRKLKW